MRRIRLAVFLALSCNLAPLAAEAQPAERVRVVAMMINLKAAKALGMTIPQSVLLRADQVIE